MYTAFLLLEGKRSHSKDSKEKRGHERGRQVKDHRRDETRSSGVRDRNPIRHSESRYQDNARHSESRHVEVIGDSGRYVDSSRHNDGSRHGDGNRYSDLVRPSDQERHGDSDRYRFEREQSRRDRYFAQTFSTYHLPYFIIIAYHSTITLTIILVRVLHTCKHTILSMQEGHNSVWPKGHDLWP